MSYIRLIVIFFCPLIFILEGCIENNIAPGTSNVIVHLYDSRGFPGNVAVSRISIGSYPERIPDGNGITQFPVPGLPYTIRYRIEWWGEGTSLYVYDGVSNKENFVVSEDYVRGANLVQTFINFPIISPGKKGLLKFISKDVFDDDSNLFIDSSYQGSEYYIFYIPFNKSAITGKFLFFEVSYDSFTHKIISYNKYGEKTVNLKAGVNPNITFTDDDVKFNPDESMIDFNVDMPTFGYGYDTKISLSFEGYNFVSDLLLYEELFESNDKREHNLVVPSNLPTPFIIKLYNWADIVVPQEKWVFGNPGTTITLNNTIQPILYLPENNSTITDTSAFMFDSEQQGIFNIHFYPDQNFITTKKKVTLNELKNAGLTFTPNTKYYWHVEQYSDFNSIDEFLSSPYVLNPSYTSHISSNGRHFTTAP